MDEMKTLLLILSCTLLASCGKMEYEEYSARVKYCQSLGLTAYTVRPVLGVKGEVGQVSCVSQDGNQRFDSKISEDK
jgi:hypothetical protein